MRGSDENPAPSGSERVVACFAATIIVSVAGIVLFALYTAAEIVYVFGKYHRGKL